MSAAVERASKGTAHLVKSGGYHSGCSRFLLVKLKRITCGQPGPKVKLGMRSSREGYGLASRRKRERADGREAWREGGERGHLRVVEHAAGVERRHKVRALPTVQVQPERRPPDVHNRVVVRLE